MCVAFTAFESLKRTNERTNEIRCSGTCGLFDILKFYAYKAVTGEWGARKRFFNISISRLLKVHFSPFFSKTEIKFRVVQFGVTVLAHEHRDFRFEVTDARPWNRFWINVNLCRHNIISVGPISEGTSMIEIENKNKKNRKIFVCTTNWDGYHPVGHTCRRQALKLLSENNTIPNLWGEVSFETRNRPPVTTKPRGSSHIHI